MQQTEHTRELQLVERNMNRSPADLGKVWCSRLIFTLPALTPMDVALYGAVAMLQAPSMLEQNDERSIHTAALTLEILRLSLNLPANKKPELLSSLRRLTMLGALQVLPLPSEPAALRADWEYGWFCLLMPISFTVKQNCQGFCQLHIADWERIKLQLTKPSDRVKGFAAYLAIQHFIFNSKNVASICYQSQGQIGASYGVKRYSVSRTVTQLHQIGAIAMCKVLWNHNGELVERNIIASARDDQSFYDFISKRLGKAYVRILE